MDPRYTAEIFKHLEMQNELLLESHSSVSHQLHKLQVEEEMLMRKFHELMKAQAVNKKVCLSFSFWYNGLGKLL
ncbi:hypothetical protein E1A91_D03G029900v1 [Gossypium mustelinum]|uniref:Uncharacterized protein n=1 Tax=Gossypium mustelinum TaxID=34275 RepID=A0A5D2VJ01_GOSMU|nr:hypothetical protein E1A91_D03G029900v1 [Gossypium mustelinum]TYI89092.1 hypothetical protein E1A91_D03G029900v1 [Gossypium mustelinum]